jgi:hypothetical protein
MPTRSSFRSCPAVLACCLFLLALLAACGSRRASNDQSFIQFVHATDPHIFLPADPNDAGNKARDAQQDAGEKALRAMFDDLRARQTADGRFPFVILTGDLGVDPCLIAKDDKDCVGTADAKLRDAEIARLAQIFASSPVPEIYLVAGNNDLAHEAAGGPPLDYFNRFIDDLQTSLANQNSSVRIHNLTRCYSDATTDLSPCYADIPNTVYRLIGFPSYSFKNTEADNSQTQSKQIQKFQALISQVRDAGKQALIISHIPDMDDPFFLAQNGLDGKSRQRPKIDDNPNPDWFTWNVGKQITDAWSTALASDFVTAVFAGHLHDSHQSIYRQPYAWTTVQNAGARYRKLFLAPPLSVKNQDTSPIQARGYSLARIAHNTVTATLFWYDPRTNRFTSQMDDRLGTPALGPNSGPAPWLAWLWILDETDTPLIRFAIVTIALLTAFLTVIAIWQIPPAQNPLAPASKNGDGDKDGPSKKKPDTSSPSGDSSPFSSRLGKTVIAGLGGFVATEVAQTLGNDKPSPESRWFYIIWFVVCFFLLMVIGNLLRAITEALRARVAIPYYSLARPAHPTPWYWVTSLPAHWISSWRVPLITFLDTFTFLIQGKNQTITKAFSDQVIDQQGNLIRVADSIRTNLTSLLETKLAWLPPASSSSNANPAANPPPANPSATGDQPGPRVRVNISVLSADQSRVFYISRTPGSAAQAFPKQSTAWISVLTGRIRWYKCTWRTQPFYDNLVLFDNSDKTIPDSQGELLFKQYYQSRHEDYKAFIMLPLPYPRRAFDNPFLKYVKGAIHISFRNVGDMEVFWTSDNDPKPDRPTFPDDAEEMLGAWCKDQEVRTVLRMAVASLGELLRGFNEVIFTDYVEPNRPD